MSGTNPASPNQLQLCKHTFGSLSPDWSLKLSCPSGACYQALSESLLVSSSIYSIFPYGSATLYAYMAVMSATDGTVINRYKSSISCTNIRGSGTNGNYIAASIFCSSAHLLMFNTATNTISIKLFSGDQLYEINLETATGRFVIGGQMSPYGVTSKLMPQSLSAHPNFQTAATWTMNILPSGVEDIVLDSSLTIGAVTSQTVSVPTPSYINIIVTYVAGTSYTSDISFLTNDLSISVLENSTYQKTPDLPCSISGSTSITFSISNYLTAAPSWVTIDSISGELIIKAPEVNADVNYYFYVNSAISGVSSPAQKLIKLTVINCSVTNCQKCLNTSGST